ncbi:MAG: hypothetical protein GX496_04580, partial [Firmicutes bacterium]|nr:hypothetical protein [Bacillota bacterium]
MSSRLRGLVGAFGALLVVTAVSILVHRLSGYDYPASQAATFELNVLGDVYEAFFLVPVGLVGLWALRRGSPWGPLVVAGVATNLAYNYAMLLTGRQNLWVLVWIAKLALAATVSALVWASLPAGPGRPTRAGRWVSGYRLAATVPFAGMMLRRLLASATGASVDMAMQAAGPLDWGAPARRDPVLFLALVCPLVGAAVAGTWQGTEWGGRAAAMSSAFIVSIGSIVLFTGPLK